MNFKELHKTGTMHRNKLLAEAFYLRGDIEKFGTGFFRIQTELKDSPEVSFKLESLNGFTRSGLEVISQDTPHDTAQVLRKLGDKLGDNQKRMLEIIGKDPQISLSHLSKKPGISQTAVENNISKLKKRGIIKRIGPTKGGYWQITETK